MPKFLFSTELIRSPPDISFFRIWINLDYRSLYFAGRGKVNDKLIFPVQPQETVHLLLVVGGDGTGSGPDSFAGQVEVLADMAGVDQDDLVGGPVIAPLHPVGDGRPDKDRRPCPHKSLPEGGVDDLLRQVFFAELEE